LSALLRAQANLDLEGRYWMPQMSANLRVERGGSGTDIDARRDLGTPDTNFPQGAVTWTHGRNLLSFTYTPIDLTGDQTVSRTIVFRGVSYTIGTRVQSDLEVRHLELRWAFQFIRLADGRVRLGPMIEADGFASEGFRERASVISAGDRAGGLEGRFAFARNRARYRTAALH
jgi:hypothetical protein